MALPSSFWNQPSLTLDEIIRWIRRFRYDPEFRDANGRYTVRLATLCRFAGIQRQNVYMIMRKEMKLTPNYRNRLTYAIRCVEHGLRFERRKDGPRQTCRYHVVGDFPKLKRYQSPKKEAGEARMPQEVFK